MSEKIPNTPFSTRLSGSTKELELRLRSIFHWKKKRPPMVFFALAVAVALLCGGLIGFSAAPRNGTLGEVYQAYFAEKPTGRIDYENKEAAYPSLTPDSEGFDEALEYVCAMEIRSVSGHKGYIGDFDNRDGAVVLTSEAGEELWIDLYRTGYVVISGKGAGRLDKGENAGVFKVSENFDTERFLSFLSAEPRAVGMDTAEQYELSGLTLDESGVGDDSVTITIYQDENGERTGMDARFCLGGGETLIWKFSESDSYVFPILCAANLTDPERQSVVVELDYRGSNYGGAAYYIFRVINGALDVYPLDCESAVYGCQVEALAGSELSCVRIPQWVSNADAPEWGSLTWDGAQWNFVSDGYHINTKTLTVDGGLELTLSLRSYRGEDGTAHYDRIEILRGKSVLQTITEASVTPDGHCPFEYFNANTALHGVLVYDIDFDGNADFGIPCNTTHNDGHAWFLYDAATRQYRFAFTLAGMPAVDPETRQITEEWRDDSVDVTYNVYEYDAQGRLALASSYQAEPAAEESALDGHESMLRRASIDGLSHMPLEDLPQEVRSDLTLVSESEFSDIYDPEWGCIRTYTSAGLDVTTTAPSAVYLEYLRECGYEESIEGEEGREWVISATIRDDRYATLNGLTVGMTLAQAKTAGYALSEGANSFGNGGEVSLTVTVEGDSVTAMEIWWGMGRYIGKYFEL